MQKNYHTHTPRCHHADGSEREYIESWFRGLEDMYGSFGRYAAEGLLLSDDDILRLREMYLE